MSQSLTGIDEDAAMLVQITDGTNTVRVDATNDGSGWVVADLDPSSFADGAPTVSAMVTDQAGNTVDASSGRILDTSADLDDAFKSLWRLMIRSRTRRSQRTQACRLRALTQTRPVSPRFLTERAVNADATNDETAGWLPTKTRVVCGRCPDRECDGDGPGGQYC